MFYVMVIAFGLLLLAKQASLIVWSISYAIAALLIVRYGAWGLTAKFLVWLPFILLVACAIHPLRRQISKVLLKRVRNAIPEMSTTEREALEAGTVSWEGDLLSGTPDFQSLLQSPTVALTPAEQAFLEGPVNELCRMIDDWEITHVHTDMPEKMWTFIKKNGFLGMIIPKKYGGLEFSATAQVAIFTKLYGRSITVGTSISVPNALGPAELLLKYGTDEQKDYYLPRLADGREIPCFALTNPNAGSDASSIPDFGIVCQQEWQGKEILGIRLTWNKRYITLCPIATVIGLAFKLYDPQNLLGKGKDVGISCALIPADTPGVIRGRRHFPLNTAFLNGPTQGKDVFVPMDYLIGGVAMAGAGWRMLMECLSVGRCISLPSSAAGGTKAAALASGAYARVRRQFNQAIANFEGIEEPLARIAGFTYIIDAGLNMAAAAIDHGAKPAIAGAILKYHSTEFARQVAVDAMDIHGGKGICLGPNNYLGRGYQNAPISITVEGANILTRSLIIFGQGIIRCHPYLFHILESIRQNDLAKFDRSFWEHVGFVLANFTKSMLFAVTDGRGLKTPETKVPRYYQLVYRYSVNFALLADVALMVLGARLKRKEKISARLGDILSYLYLTSAVLKRFQVTGEPINDLPLVHWCCQYLLYQCAVAIQGIIANLPGFGLRLTLKCIFQPFGLQRLKPSDTLGKRVADILTTPNETRTRLANYVFTEDIENCPLGSLENSFHKICAVMSLESKVLRAVKDDALSSLTFLEQINEAESCGIIDANAASLLRDAEMARQAVIAVDDFKDDELRRASSATPYVKKEKQQREDSCSVQE